MTARPTKKKKLTKRQQKWIREFNAELLPRRAQAARDAESAELVLVRERIKKADSIYDEWHRGMWAEIYLRSVMEGHPHARPRARAFLRVCKEIDDTAKAARDASTQPKNTEPQ